MKIILSESQYSKLMESLDGKDESILIVGDSHSVDSNFTYSGLIKKNFPDVKILAVGGMNTQWMKNQLTKELKKNSYDKVVIWGGANDAFSLLSVPTIISNIQEMVDMVNSQGGNAYVIVGFDQKIFSKPGKYGRSRYFTPKQMDEGREKYIEIQEQIPNSISNATIIPAFDIDHSHTSDNMHGNSVAHKKVYNLVTDYLSKGVSKLSVDKKTENKKKGDDILNNIKQYVEGDQKFYFKDRNYVFQQEVEDIQTGLQFLKFSLPQWGVDGKFGPETERAVQEFQKSVGIEETGIMDKETMESLVTELEKNNFQNEELSDIVFSKTEEFGNFVPSEKIVLQDDNLKVRPYPSNLVERFKKIAGDYYETFISDVSSIGLDPMTAIRQLYTESGFSPDVIECDRKSSAGAMGIAQFMPGTWPSYGSGSPCNVKDSLKAYVRFMNYLLDRFPGRPDIAVAAYNSGPNLKSYKRALDNSLSFESLRGRIPNESYKYATTIFQA